MYTLNHSGETMRILALGEGLMARPVELKDFREVLVDADTVRLPFAGDSLPLAGDSLPFLPGLIFSSVTATIVMLEAREEICAMRPPGPFFLISLVVVFLMTAPVLARR